jgi:hypothetical protein
MSHDLCAVYARQRRRTVVAFGDGSGVVSHFGDSGFARATGATIKRFVRLDAMPDDFAPTVIANRRQRMDRALEAVENMLPARRDHLEGEIIVVTANFTLGHINLLPRLVGQVGNLPHQP